MKRIKTLVYDTLEKDNKSYVPTAHYPSSASFKFSSGELVGPDMLDQYLKWTGVTPSNPSDSPSLLRMKLGDGVHGVLAKIFSKCGLKVLTETAGRVQIEGLKYPISYRTDQLIEMDGELIVLEVKSSTEQQMFGKGWGIQDKGPKMDHILQVICYLQLVPMVKAAKLLYIARDTGRMIEYDITNHERGYAVDGKLIPELSWQGIIDRWVRLEKIVADKMQPEPEYKVWINEKTGEVMDKKTIKGEFFKSDWRALYSPYLDLVWKNPDNFKYTYNAQHVLSGYK